MQCLRGKIAIVTGGGTGIGRAISEQLAQAGASVAIIYSRSHREAGKTVEAIRSLGGHASAIETDISDARAVDRMIETVATAYGRIDYLVNNAGITRQLKFDDLEAANDEIWDDLLAVNVKGTFHCSRAAAPFLKQRPGASIVNIGSIAGETGYGSSLPYAVSKSAMHGLTKSLARALAPEVRVNCVAPGAVATRWWAGNEDKMRMLSGELALKRISTPGDIATTVLMLLTADSLTGQIIKLDNGQTL